MKQSLIEFAKEKKYITGSDYDKLVAFKENNHVSDETAMLESKILSDDKTLELFGVFYGYDTRTDIADIDLGDISSRFKYRVLFETGFIPWINDGQITIITSRPSRTLFAEDYLTQVSGYKGNFKYIIVSEKNLQKLISKSFKLEDNVEIENIDDFEGTENIVYNVSDSDSSSVVNLVNKIFRQAVESGISDIHIEPQSDYLRIRYREDGLLKEVMKFPKNISGRLINRIKTMSNLDVNNNRIIQDGNTRLDIFGKTIDLRISIIPAVNGENVVIRILDRNKMKFDISMLGFSKENEQKFYNLIKKPQGIILLTGPTGSGKSTSLYAALSVLNSIDKCIITFENPIEYQLPGIVQVQVNTSSDVTFANALNSGLRQDIEVALVGEIRDKETADIAFDAANTGHMVFSTLHTNSAASSILRLVKMGIEPFMVSRTLTGVINQRLARRICPKCKTQYHLERDSPYRKVLKCGNNDVVLYRGKGCPECDYTGYKGRIAVNEFLVVNDAIGDLLDRNANTHEIEQLAVLLGMKKIQQDGIDKALLGLTTLDEIHRVVFFDELMEE